MTKSKPKTSWQLSNELKAAREREGGIKATVALCDPGIRHAVQILLENGVETFESCEGGPGHCFPEPTVRFCAAGRDDAGWHALSIARTFNLPVAELRFVWVVRNGYPIGPHWEMTFTKLL